MAEMLTTPGRYPRGKAPASETESGIWSRKSEQQEIMPGVFITSANGAVARKRDKRALRDARISHVLRVGAEFTDERNYPTSPDLVYETLASGDNGGANWGTFEEGPLGRGITFMESALRESTSNRVLVHCQAGQSRSGTVVVAYVLFKLHVGYAEALRYVQARRPVVEPARRHAAGVGAEPGAGASSPGDAASCPGRLV